MRSQEFSNALTVVEDAFDELEECKPKLITKEEARRFVQLQSRLNFMCMNYIGCVID